MKPILEVHKLSKKFKRPQKVDKNASFWALDDVSFSLYRGESLALVGKNGSGKSTMLKILASILLPTKGHIIVRGKIAALLELGAGFHPELTGRENIFVYGALLGIKRREIKQLFDEIVAFSEIEDSIDSPVKSYSSGMQMRLAFSVAAFLSPDILLVDEVLAVGDQAFQKKCLNRIQKLQANGTSIILVSHSMATVSAFCNKGMLLQNGKIKHYGNIQDVANLYLKNSSHQHFQIKFEPQPNQLVSPIKAWIETKKGEAQKDYYLEDAIILAMIFSIKQEETYEYLAGFHVYNHEGILVCPATYKVCSMNDSSVGEHSLKCTLPPFLLNTGLYYVTIAVSSWQPSYQLHFKKEQVLSFVINENIQQRELNYNGEYPGIIRPKLQFDHSSK